MNQDLEDVLSELFDVKERAYLSLTSLQTDLDNLKLAAKEGISFKDGVALTKRFWFNNGNRNRIINSLSTTNSVNNKMMLFGQELEVSSLFETFPELDPLKTYLGLIVTSLPTIINSRLAELDEENVNRFNKLIFDFTSLMELGFSPKYYNKSSDKFITCLSQFGDQTLQTLSDQFCSNEGDHVLDSSVSKTSAIIKTLVIDYRSFNMLGYLDRRLSELSNKVTLIDMLLKHINVNG